MSWVKNPMAWWQSIMARQLRKPSGILANLTGKRMNVSNEALYELAFQNIDVKDDDSILEIGFGNGRFFSDLATKAKNLKIIGLDHSPEMVNEAKRLNKNLIKSGSLVVVEGSSEQLPFASESFDLVFGINLIYFWENPSLHLQEVHRVLKPGGHFCVGIRPKENLINFPFSKFGFKLTSEAEWQAILIENGFQIIKSAHGKSPSLKNKKKKPFESLCMVYSK